MSSLSHAPSRVHPTDLSAWCEDCLGRDGDPDGPLPEWLTYGVRIESVTAPKDGGGH